MYWSGTSATIRFSGASLSATLKDEHGDNYFYVVIDNEVQARIHPDSTQHEYVLADHLPAGIHTATLFKLTEGTMGKTWLYGFAIKGAAKVLPALPPPHRKMEFYGNSITSGYSVDDTAGDSRKPEYFNNYKTYAAITARHYGAAYSCISKSGIGLLISWFPIIMPEMYDRLDPNDANSHWDFNQYTPDVVVVDLMQNDSWLVHKPDHAQFRARFGTTPPTDSAIVSAYTRFISSIRQKYPRATIICTLGSMDATAGESPWPGYVQQAVKHMNDTRILTHFFPFNYTGKHPKAKEQQAMADELTAFIDANVNW